MKLWDKLKHAYSILTSDLSLPDIMRSMKSDASNTYQFFTKETGSGHETQAKKPKIFRLLKNLFLAFIRKLTPVRRIAYIVALFLFFSGLNNESGKGKIFLGFALLNILLAAELADKLLAKDELDIARNIQMNMMPKNPPHDDRFDIAFKYDSANTVGGDFYDFIISPKKRGFIAIVGDISGKGMEAAIHMVQVHAMIHAAPYPQDLKIMLLDLNKQLRAIFPTNQFLTANFLKIGDDRILEFIRAGHIPLYYYSSKTDYCETISPAGLGLGLTVKGKFERSLVKNEIHVSSGDILCLCTDGAIETENAKAVEFGETRLKNALTTLKLKSAEQIIQELLLQINQFRGSAPKKDDLTLLILKVK